MLKINKKINYFIISFLAFVNNFIYAAGGTGSGQNQIVKIGNPGFMGDLNKVLHTLIAALIKISIPLLVLAFVYIGFLFVQAQGEPEELKKIKKYFIWALVGALIILGADMILTTIEDSVKNSDLFK